MWLLHGAILTILQAVWKADSHNHTH